MPVLSPQIVDVNHPFPHLLNKEVYIVANLKLDDRTMMGIVPIPQFVPKIVYLPGHDVRYIRIEKVILEYMELIFGQYQVSDKNYICVTRNADISPDDDSYADNDDFRFVMQKPCTEKNGWQWSAWRWQAPLEKRWRSFFCEKFNVTQECIFRTKMPMTLDFVFSVIEKVPDSMKRSLTDETFCSSAVGIGGGGQRDGPGEAPGHPPFLPL